MRKYLQQEHLRANFQLENGGRRRVVLQRLLELVGACEYEMIMWGSGALRISVSLYSRHCTSQSMMNAYV